MMQPIDRLIYEYSCSNMDYFVWQIAVYDFPLYYIVLFPIFLFFFPIIAAGVPLWDKTFGQEGAFYPLPLLVHKNKELAKQMQSKLFWSKCCKENGIPSPTIYYHLKGGRIVPIEPIVPGHTEYIMKPTYGTCGQNVEKVDVSDVEALLQEYKYYENDLLVQEYVRDCYTDMARHIRLYTISTGKRPVFLFSIYEFKQTDREKVASNLGDIESTVCIDNLCDFLSPEEQRHVRDISKRLVALHQERFLDAACIGWDVMLTCSGPYVLEGNMGAGVKPYQYESYIESMKEAYFI